MINAKDELLEILQNKAQIKCAKIIYGDEERVVLKLNYDSTDYKEFLEKLSFQYDSGYGSQELFGTVWLEDNTWLSRFEYDGSEWWQHNFLPPIPKECIS